MSRHGRRMRAVVVLAATTTGILAASAGSALAAGQAVCVVPGAPLIAAQDGTCKNGQLTELAVQSEVDALKTRVAALESDNTTLRGEVTTLDSKVSALERTLSRVSYDAAGLNGKPTLTIDGANLQIVSGSGRTSGTVNGLGNLFIGYNEQREDVQTGSHNLILGQSQSFTSFGGLLAGFDNTVTGVLSSVTGGDGNTASGAYSSVSGGGLNTASGTYSSVSGGSGNTPSGLLSSVSGGRENTASGSWSSILGGRDVTVSTQYGTSP